MIEKYPDRCKNHIIRVVGHDFTIEDAYNLLRQPEEWHIYFDIHLDQDAEDYLSELHARISSIEDEIEYLNDDNQIDKKYEEIGQIAEQIERFEEEYPVRCAEKLRELYEDYIEDFKRQRDLCDNEKFVEVECIDNGQLRAKIGNYIIVIGKRTG